MGKNFCSLPILKSVDIHNLQRTKTELQEKNKPIQKWAKDINRNFTKEDIHESNKHIKNAHHHWSLERCKSKPH